MELEGEPKSQTNAGDAAAGMKKKKNNHLTLLSSPILNLFPSLLLLLPLPSSSSSSKSATSPLSIILHLIRHLILLSLLLFLFFISPFLQSPDPPQQTHQAHLQQPSPSSSLPTCERALAHVLSLVSHVPVASRKYDLIRSLADRLLDDNVRLSASLNREALSLAFRRTLGGLESSVVCSTKKAEGSKDLIDSVVGLVRSEVRRWTVEVEVEEEVPASEVEVPAEKMAAELLWLAGKMAECGAMEEAVKVWGEAEGLAKVALKAEPRVQVALVRVSAFLFKQANTKPNKQANTKQFGRKKGGEREDECRIFRYGMAMLKSWLPLLCYAPNGTDSPLLSSAERAKMVKVLEEMVEKLNWEEQEEVLGLWLHHFTSCPDSDWPNLESCYTRWYSKSRDLSLK